MAPSSSPITYSIKKNGGESKPDWLEYNNVTAKFEGTAPEVEEETTYSFKFKSEWKTKPKGDSSQIITLKVKPKEEESTSKSISLAATSGGAAAGAGVSAVTSALTGNPPTGLYAILHQLQLIILFLMIDPFIPDTLKTYLEGQGFVLVNFNMIPSADIPGIDIPVDWLESEQTNEALSALGIESKSTLVNNLSLFLMIGLIIFIHVMLRYILV